MHEFERVEVVARQLESTDGDRRIPALVRHYFSDMHEMFGAVFRGLRPGGQFLLDIGDSKFYGVHVPTDRLLAEIACHAGFVLRHRHVLARRHSRDKSPLVQVELVFEKVEAKTQRKSRSRDVIDNLESQAADFQNSLAYKEPPFSKRNWGHPLHSLCSYQGKLKPAIAHWLIRQFVPPNASVLDPLGGVGTVAFEAALQGHRAVSNDKSPFAAVVARAKLNPPNLEDIKGPFASWWDRIEAVPDSRLDESSADFGLNGSVKDFFHPKTLRELLRARHVFAEGQNFGEHTAFVWASLLHVLHGNRPYALSRTSHPITPFHPRGPRPYRSVREKVWQRIALALRVPLPDSFVSGLGVTGDFRDLQEHEVGLFDAIITSPPFMGMRFDRPNWLRLWFCGWGESDFHQTSLGFLERQQVRSTDVYREFFLSMGPLLKKHGVLIIHVGSGGKEDLVGSFAKLVATFLRFAPKR